MLYIIQPKTNFLIYHYHDRDLLEAYFYDINYYLASLRLAQIKDSYVFNINTFVKKLRGLETIKKKIFRRLTRRELAWVEYLACCRDRMVPGGVVKKLYIQAGKYYISSNAAKKILSLLLYRPLTCLYLPQIYHCRQCERKYQRESDLKAQHEKNMM